jgi:hypothetical protein
MFIPFHSQLVALASRLHRRRLKPAATNPPFCYFRQFNTLWLTLNRYWSILQRHLYSAVATLITLASKARHLSHYRWMHRSPEFMLTPCLAGIKVDHGFPKMKKMSRFQPFHLCRVPGQGCSQTTNTLILLTKFCESRTFYPGTRSTQPWHRGDRNTQARELRPGIRRGYFAMSRHVCRVFLPNRPVRSHFR